MKAEVDKLDINKLTYVPTTLNNLETKVDDFDVGKLKTVPVNLKKLRNVIDNEVVQNTKFNRLNTKFNRLNTKINNLVTKRITRRLYITLEKPNKDSKYLVKY